MALTDEQRAAGNKAANDVREKAHGARCKAYRAAMEAVEHSPEVLEARRAFEAADAAESVALARRDAQTLGSTAQISGLDRRELALANAVSRSAAEAWYTLQQNKYDEVDARFADLQGDARFSASKWKTPPETLAAMQAARQRAAATRIAHGCG